MVCICFDQFEQGKSIIEHTYRHTILVGPAAIIVDSELSCAAKHARLLNMYMCTLGTLGSRCGSSLRLHFHSYIGYHNGMKAVNRPQLALEEATGCKTLDINLV